MTDLFAEKARDYDERPLPQQISEGVFAKLDARVPLRPDQSVLDFGAGTGLLASKMAPRVGSILAVDVSPAMLEQLADKAALQGKVRTVCQDILQDPLDLQVDLVVSAMALHHVEDTDRLLRVLRSHLRPGGRIALADLDAEDGDFHPPDTEGVFHHGFDRGALGRRAEAAGFAAVEFETACEVEREGRRYPIFLLTAERPGA